MAQKTRTQIQTEITNEVVSNNDRGITAQILNTIFTDLNDSTINTLTDATNFGLYEFDISKSYNLNQATIYNKQLYKATQNISPGTFSVNQWELVNTEKKWVVNLIGNTNNNPTAYTRSNTLFTGTATVVRIGLGVFRITLPVGVFNNQFSLEFTSWDNAQDFPAFPISQNVGGNIMEYTVLDYDYTPTDLYKGYLTITQYL